MINPVALALMGVGFPAVDFALRGKFALATGDEGTCVGDEASSSATPDDEASSSAVVGDVAAECDS